MPNKAEMQMLLAERKQAQASPFDQFTEWDGINDSPEARALREFIFNKLYSGAYDDSQRRKMPLDDFRSGVRAFLGTSTPTGGEAQSRSLGYPAGMSALLQGQNFNAFRR